MKHDQINRPQKLAIAAALEGCVIGVVVICSVAPLWRELCRYMGDSNIVVLGMVVYIANLDVEYPYWLGIENPPMRYSS